MTEAEILAGIEEVARQHVGWEESVRPEMLLAEDLELDSLKKLTLAVEVENRFKICLDPESDTQILTVADLVAAIRSKLGD
jgi:acyl carrier protein